MKNNRWTLVKRLPDRKCICKCDCGTEKEIFYHHFTSGSSKSCGCLQKEESSIVNSTHGLSKSPLYKIWKGMNTRCNNPNTNDYKNYGGRGIQIGYKDFEEFYNDMIDGYKKGLTVDRKDVNGDYKIGNCRWATRLEQANNKRK